MCLFKFVRKVVGDGILLVAVRGGRGVGGEMEGLAVVGSRVNHGYTVW